jgi:hypothetical protein
MHQSRPALGSVMSAQALIMAPTTLYSPPFASARSGGRRGERRQRLNDPAGPCAYLTSPLVLLFETTFIGLSGAFTSASG